MSTRWPPWCDGVARPKSAPRTTSSREPASRSSFETGRRSSHVRDGSGHPRGGDGRGR
jgi:hypothetical protein